MPAGNEDSKRAIYTATGPVGGSGPTGALAFVNACKALPPTSPSVRSNGNGYTWFAGYPWHIAVNAYTHVGTPNTRSCTNTADQGGVAELHRAARLGPAQQQSPRRGEYVP